ncbi:hypothetical protein QR680_006143 [Steinernema hermaphroditum]|uniref:Uncharacterized protein n=1 Tax=Steinernema hermaphroditum TaxID=289476 RepID=A0AA39HWV9_9BILA|nr:hypothetical protein QR680_006143 [Steinernema hermaphroditum]
MTIRPVFEDELEFCPANDLQIHNLHNSTISRQFGRAECSTRKSDKPVDGALDPWRTLLWKTIQEGGHFPTMKLNFDTSQLLPPKYEIALKAERHLNQNLKRTSKDYSIPSG